jgi:hypothetical protein
MAVDATGSLARATTSPVGELLLDVWARLAACHLDARLGAAEDPCSSAALARRASQLVSRRARRRSAIAIERVCFKRRERPVFSAAIPVDGRAVEIARPALAQLARALRSRESVEPRGAALTQSLLTDAASPLYRPAYPEELYEAAREALLALTPVGLSRRRLAVRGAGNAQRPLDRAAPAQQTAAIRDDVGL